MAKRPDREKNGFHICPVIDYSRQRRTVARVDFSFSAPADSLPPKVDPLRRRGEMEQRAKVT